MTKNPVHKSNIISLRRIEGQVKGIQRMVDEEKYCVDIVTQIHAAINSLHVVAEKILARHMEHCVVDAFKSKSDAEKGKKIQEMIKIFKRLRKL